MLVMRSMIGGLIDRREQPAALEIVGDDLGDADADFGVGRRARHEIRNRDRQRRELALGNDDPLWPPAARRHWRPLASVPSAADAGRSSGGGSSGTACRAISSSVGHVGKLRLMSGIAVHRVQVFRSVNTGAKYFHSSKKAAGQIIRLAFDDRAHRRSPDRRADKASPACLPGPAALQRAVALQSNVEHGFGLSSPRCRHRASSSSARPAA